MDEVTLIKQVEPGAVERIRNADALALGWKDLRPAVAGLVLGAVAALIVSGWQVAVVWTGACGTTAGALALCVIAYERRVDRNVARLVAMRRRDTEARLEEHGIRSISSQMGGRG